MTASKFNVYRTSLKNHPGNRGINKEWHELLIVNTTLGRTLHIQRWGASGKWGSMDVERHERAHDLVEHRKAVDLAVARGFVVKSTHSLTNWTDMSLEELQKMFATTYWFKLGPANVAFIAPEADTSGMREPDPIPEYVEEDGKFRAKRPPPRTFEIPEETVEEKIAENELWGMF